MLASDAPVKVNYRTAEQFTDYSYDLSLYIGKEETYRLHGDLRVRFGRKMMQVLLKYARR